ncbi:hypothetical protein GCM10009127_24500 [Alteraurantiacibacter aestuarii]|uniref:DUF4349 domain-containing protein n=1 Tax=Alteraurantiacibacter aestuarii TaxID=650004 RepID=UPI0031D94E8E
MEESPGDSADYAVTEENASGELASLSGRPDIPVTMPRMAYVFDYGFSMPGARIAGLQLRHADMCEAMGPYSCQIVAMTHSGGEDDFASGRLELAVAADRARAFVAEINATLEGAGGEQVRANITGEDLSKSMIDTEARLRSRIELRDRLMDVLRTRRGDVAELVEAERSVARINEEIDQARSWMEEMRGRVAFSRVQLSYQSASPVASSFLGPINTAFASIGGIIGNVLAALIVLLSILTPLGLAVWAARHGYKRLRPGAELVEG